MILFSRVQFDFGFKLFQVSIVWKRCFNSNKLLFNIYLFNYLWGSPKTKVWTMEWMKSQSIWHLSSSHINSPICINHFANLTFIHSMQMWLVCSAWISYARSSIKKTIIWMTENKNESSPNWMRFSTLYPSAIRPKIESRNFGMFRFYSPSFT